MQCLEIRWRDDLQTAITQTFTSAFTGKGFFIYKKGGLMNSQNKKARQGRRFFLKWTGFSLTASTIVNGLHSPFAFAETVVTSKNYWHKNPQGEDYCKQSRVYATSLNSDAVYARVDNWWRKYPIRELHDEFIQWYAEEKLEVYRRRAEGGEVLWGGAHHPVVATYGNKKGRGDSFFHLNNTVKGIHLCPTYEKLIEMNNYIASHRELGADEIRAYLGEFYSDPNNFDRTKLISIEYYSKNPDLMRVSGYKETHTFLNMMENPIATICFLALWKPNFCTEIRAIPCLLDPANPNLTEEEQQYVKYPSNLYGWFHHKDTMYIACIYRVVEVFSQGTLPSASNDDGRGIRVVPPPPVWLAWVRDGLKKFARWA
jgi:hypothetical protein